MYDEPKKEIVQSLNDFSEYELMTNLERQRIIEMSTKYLSNKKDILKRLMLFYIYIILSSVILAMYYIIFGGNSKLLEVVSINTVISIIFIIISIPLIKLERNEIKIYKSIENNNLYCLHCKFDKKKQTSPLQNDIELIEAGKLSTRNQRIEKVSLKIYVYDDINKIDIEEVCVIPLNKERTRFIGFATTYLSENFKTENTVVYDNKGRIQIENLEELKYKNKKRINSLEDFSIGWHKPIMREKEFLNCYYKYRKFNIAEFIIYAINIAVWVAAYDVHIKPLMLKVIESIKTNTISLLHIEDFYGIMLLLFINSIFCIPFIIERIKSKGFKQPNEIEVLPLQISTKRIIRNEEHMYYEIRLMSEYEYEINCYRIPYLKEIEKHDFLAIRYRDKNNKIVYDLIYLKRAE